VLHSEHLEQYLLPVLQDSPGQERDRSDQLAKRPSESRLSYHSQVVQDLETYMLIEELILAVIVEATLGVILTMTVMMMMRMIIARIEQLPAKQHPKDGNESPPRDSQHQPEKE
jgi:hypothetical protein